MKKIMILIGVILALIINACTYTQTQPVCNDPYILVGTECCLDQNSNKICDNDDYLQQDYSNSRANCNSYCAQKNKPKWDNPGFSNNVVKAGYEDCEELMAQEKPPKSWFDCEKQKNREEENVPEETTQIQPACAQDVQFDVKAACYDDPANGGTGGVRFIVENNGNRDIINFTARFKVTDTDVVAGETLSGISKFGLKTYTATAVANPVVNNMVVTDLAGNEALIREVTLVPVIKIGGKEITCSQSIDSYAPTIEDSVLNRCDESEQTIDETIQNQFRQLFSENNNPVALISNSISVKQGASEDFAIGFKNIGTSEGSFKYNIIISSAPNNLTSVDWMPSGGDLGILGVSNDTSVILPLEVPSDAIPSTYRFDIELDCTADGCGDGNTLPFTVRVTA